MTREEAIKIISIIDEGFKAHIDSVKNDSDKYSVGYALCAIESSTKSRQALEMAKEALENCTDVKRGYWAVDKEDVYWGNSLIKRYCSVCKAVPHFDKEERKFILTDFCHYCGARMDGEENGK